MVRIPNLFSQEHLNITQLNFINQSMGITASYNTSDWWKFNVSLVESSITRRLDVEYIKLYLHRNAEGCYVKKNPNIFPFQ